MTREEIINELNRYMMFVSNDEKFSNAIEKMFKKGLDSVTISINEDEDRNKEMSRYDE